MQELATLFESEISFFRKKQEIKIQLLKNPYYSKSKSYQEISKGDSQISMDHIVDFLSMYYIDATKLDLEALLRRYDHDSDMNISYAEFSELTTYVETRPS